MLDGVFFQAQPEEVREELFRLLKANVLSAAILLSLDFTTKTVRFCNRNISVQDGKDGHTWEPIRVNAGWEDVEGGPDNLAPLRRYFLTIPLDLARQFGAEEGPFPDLEDKTVYQGRIAQMSLQVLDPGVGPQGTDKPVGYPAVLHTGRMDSLRVSITREGVRHQMNVESILARKAIRGSGTLTPRDQKARYPGDLGLDYVTGLDTLAARWPRQ